MHTYSFNVTRANKQAYVTQNIVHLSNIEQKNGLILTFMRDIFYGGETTLQDTGSSVVLVPSLKMLMGGGSPAWYYVHGRLGRMEFTLPMLISRRTHLYILVDALSVRFYLG